MSDPTEPRTGERIAKLLARAGIASRREVERMIAEGRVKIGDEVVTTPATVLGNLRGVSVDGNPVRAAEVARLFAFHKPSGLLTAETDPAGRPTIYAALRNALPPGTPRMMPVGRLDLNTEGLLLLTNDGELKRAMELPSSGVPRTYRARTFGDVTQAQLEELMDGVTIEGMHYSGINANMERKTGRNQWIELTLTEGKNREVRRVLEHLGLQVSRLLRTSYGPFELADLPRGQTAEIRPADVEKFRATLNIRPDTGEARPAHDQARARIQRARPSTAAPRRPDDRGDQRRGGTAPASDYNPAVGKPAASKPAPRGGGAGKAYAKPASPKPGTGKATYGKPAHPKPAYGKPAYGKPTGDGADRSGPRKPAGPRSSGSDRPNSDRPHSDRPGPNRRGPAR